jgi:L-alanine-DL-glutamate epimerase-like enolase superfamily enzyme
MKITEITAEKINLELVKPFTIALGTITESDNILVSVETDEGITGYGEGAAVPFVTGETPEIILAAVFALREGLIGLDPRSIGHIHRVMDETLVGNGAAKAAIDIALYDVIGKHAETPLYKLLGGHRSSVETDMTVGIDRPEIMAQTAAELVAQGFRQIKIKAGIRPEDDVEAVRLIRKAVGPDIRLKVDANQGWSAGDAMMTIASLAACGVDAVEQPVPAWDVEGLAAVRAKAPIKIMADESCFTPQDALRLVARGAVDMINIKLMKCGGLYPAMQINAIATAAGIPCMVGCMLESRLAIAAGAAFIASDPNIVYGDVDSFRDFKENGIVSGGFDFDCPTICLTEAPGLGVTVKGADKNRR